VADVFGWIGSTRRERLLALVDDEVQAWMSAWSCLPSATVVVDELTDEGLVPTDGFLMGDVVVGTNVTMSDLGAGMVGITDTSNPLAAHLGHRALADLLSRLAGSGAGASETVSWDQLPRALRDSCMGAVRVAIRLPNGVVIAALGRRQVDRRAPVMARERTPTLASRRSAIDGLLASLRVELDLGDVALGDARALSPGDVLVTQIPLTKWADIFVDAQALPMMRGRPGSADGRRAVAIELLDEKESET
jgi:hypothetical protein